MRDIYFGRHMFYVTGDDNDKLLLHTLELALSQKIFLNNPTTIEAWAKDEATDGSDGLLLYEYREKDTIPFPSPLNAGQLFHVVKSFLVNHGKRKDGYEGWLVHYEEGDKFTIAVRPQFIYYGK